MKWDIYINTVVGKPWVNRSTGPDSFDCWGLVVDSLLNVDCIEAPDVDGYIDNEPIENIGTKAIKSVFWLESSESDAHIFACYDNNNNMVHVGRVTPHGALHAFGMHGNGQVSLHTIPTIRRLMILSNPRFKEIKFYRVRDGNV
ncbi:MAG: hypothetical protein ACPH3C_08140 [Glaciecola sp.]